MRTILLILLIVAAFALIAIVWPRIFPPHMPVAYVEAPSATESTPEGLNRVDFGLTELPS